MCVYLLHSVDWTLLWFLYSFQLVCAALHQITSQNSFDLTHNRLWAQVREILV